jgi:GST-like protein
MIDLYTWSTPNGRKVSVMLEELGTPYQAFPININKGEQFAPDFLRISPNNRIPAIVDHAPPASFGPGEHAIFESGAILWYLAEKSGRFLPPDPRGQSVCLQWLMFQMGGLGPMLGQAHHFRRFAPDQIPYAIKRYSDEAARLYKVMNGRLESCAYLAGADYTIADVACYPWIARHEWQGQNLADYPALESWYRAIEARPAVKRGFEVP